MFRKDKICILASNQTGKVAGQTPKVEGQKR
jgi:hypothetical protein